MSKALATIVALLLSSGVCHAATLTFDELSAEIPAGGLTQGGVTFIFPPAGPLLRAATYGGTVDAASFFGQLTDNVLEGPVEGVLTLDFLVPTSFLQFDVGLAYQGSLVSGFTVQLSGSGSPTASTDVATSVINVLSEGRFIYDNTVTGPPGALISRAVITFNAAPSSFALDNLTYDAGFAVPEPSAACLFGAGLVLLAALRRTCGAWRR